MITWDDLKNGFLLGGFLFLVSSVIFAFSFGVASIWQHSNVLLRGKRIISMGLLVGAPLGFTGIIAGFLSGSSRSPAMTALIPAILTFIGLAIVYLMGRGPLRAIISAFAVFVFSFNLLVGAFLGSASRDRHAEFLRSVGVQKLNAEREFAVRAYRKGLGLPLDVVESNGACNFDKP